eukprot:scaffold14717_cov168-Ochromonas_danica.AAC.21
MQMNILESLNRFCCRVAESLAEAGTLLHLQPSTSDSPARRGQVHVHVHVQPKKKKKKKKKREDTTQTEHGFPKSPNLKIWTI